MIYLLLLIGALLFHSIYSLLIKYNGKEPVWLKIYGGCGLLFILVIPIIIIADIANKFNLSGASQLYISAIITIAMIVAISNVLPKNKKDFWDN